MDTLDDVIELWEESTQIFEDLYEEYENDKLYFIRTLLAYSQFLLKRKNIKSK